MNPSMPALFVGRRRLLLLGLAGLGLLQAALSVAVAVLTPRLLTAGAGAWGLAAALLVAALLVGGARILERVAAEDLGQDYVRETRRLLVTSALVPEKSLNLGSTIARTTNDLTAVKNWIALGISPIVVGVPLIVGIVIGLFVLLPTLGLVVVVTLGVFFTALWALSRVFFRRAVAVRRVRGKMAGYVADTVTAAGSIRTAGGVQREVGRVDRISGQLQDAAHRRAVVSGTMRGSAASITTVLGVLVAITGSAAGSTGAAITTAVFIAGMLGAPVTELGRVGEYRQNYNAACRVLRPIIENARGHARREKRQKRARTRMRHHGNPRGLSRDAVHLADLRDAEGTIPSLVAAPGSRVLLTGGSRERLERVTREITGDMPASDAWITVAGRHLYAMTAKDRRELIGVAARDVPLQRGTISRIVRYRHRGAGETVAQVLDRVGMAERVARLPEGDATRLKRGGEPLSINERALLKIAGAVAGNPPLLVLDHVDDQLDARDRPILRRILADYPGCVILRSASPHELLERYEVYNVDELAPTLVVAPSVLHARIQGKRPTTYVPGADRNPFGPPVRHSAVELAGTRAASAPRLGESADDLEGDDE